MQGFKFVHAADIHLDSPFKGISKLDDEVGRLLGDATFRAFERVVDRSIDEDVDFLLVAGDVYDGSDRSLRAQLRFRDGLSRLHEAGIASYVVHGNHDPLSGWSTSLLWPESTHVFGGGEPETVTHERDGTPIARIHGVSFRERNVRENLSLRFPERTEDDGLFHIGLLHCNVGADTGHEPYAPCTVDDLLSRNYHYWALGHVHTRRDLNDDPPIHYPGNPQGLQPNETGPRGCTLVDVDGSGRTDLRLVDTTQVRWVQESLSIGGLYDLDELESALVEMVESVREEGHGRPSICRIRLTGRGPLFHTLARPGTLDDLAGYLRESEEGERDIVWVESISNGTGPDIDRERLRQRTDFLGDLVRIVDEMRGDRGEMDQLCAEIDPLLSSTLGRKYIEKVSEEELVELLSDAENLCLDRLLGSVEDEDR